MTLETVFSLKIIKINESENPHNLGHLLHQFGWVKERKILLISTEYVMRHNFHVFWRIFFETGGEGVLLFLVLSLIHI